MASKCKAGQMKRNGEGRANRGTDIKDSARFTDTVNDITLRSLKIAYRHTVTFQTTGQVGLHDPAVSYWLIDRQQQRSASNHLDYR